MFATSLAMFKARLNDFDLSKFAVLFNGYFRAVCFYINVYFKLGINSSPAGLKPGDIHPPPHLPLLLCSYAVYHIPTEPET